MKEYFLIFALLATAQLAVGQDTLFVKNEGKVVCKVLEIRSYELSYTEWEAYSGEDRSMAISALEKVVFSNGVVEDFADFKGGEVIGSSVVSYEGIDMFEKGFEDATGYYPGARLFWPTFGASLYPPAGLVTAVTIGASAVHPEKFAPDLSLLENEEYYDGFYTKAKRRKWLNAGLGFLAGTATAYVIVAGVFIAFLL